MAPLYRLTPLDLEIIEPKFLLGDEIVKVRGIRVSHGFKASKTSAS